MLTAFALPCPALPYPALHHQHPVTALCVRSVHWHGAGVNSACPALPCPALPGPALPCPALPGSALLTWCDTGQYSSMAEMGRLKAELLLAREDLLAERAARLRYDPGISLKDSSCGVALNCHLHHGQYSVYSIDIY